jgi:Fur family ferric uptake transcriptional regulator
MSHVKQDFAGRIREAGYRLTPQRQLILDVICAAGAASFDEICQAVTAAAPGINQATIYRALNFFQEMDLVVTAERPEETVYEIASATPHHHLVCDACGTVMEIEDTHLAPLRQQLQDAFGFSAALTHLTIPGRCADCQKN